MREPIFSSNLGASVFRDVEILKMNGGCQCVQTFHPLFLYWNQFPLCIESQAVNGCFVL